MGKVHPVPADVELFATFTIPQVEEASLSDSRGAGLWCNTPTDCLELRSVFLDRCQVRALCSDSNFVCTHKATSARVDRLVVCVYVDEKWCEDTPLR